MGNFARPLRQALRYRWTVAGTVVSSLVVAVLWGLNIGTLYPVVEVIFVGQSLGHKVRTEIESASTEAAQLRTQIAKLEKSADPHASESSELSSMRLRLERVEQDATLYRRVQPWVDHLPDDPFKTLVVIVSLLVLATFIKSIFMATGAVLVDRLAHLATFDLRNQFYRRTLRMDLGAFGESGTSDLLSRFTYDTDCVCAGIQTLFGRAVREPLKMIVCLAGAAWVCWRLLLVSLVIAPLAVLLIAMLARTLKRANRKAMEEMSVMYNVLAETFGGIRVVKAFTMERFERTRFHRISKICYHKAMRIALWDGLVSPLTELMGICTVSLAILCGAYLVLNHETHLLGLRMCDRPLSLGGLIVFYGWLIGTSDPARKMSEVFNRLQRGVAAADRVYQLLDREPAVSDPINARPLPRHSRDLVFENVAFSYRSGSRVLEDINLTIRQGETVAVVGPNGCGKSTLASLVPRFFDPAEGCVRLDGTDLRAARLLDLRSQIGIVTQDTVLFEDSVYDNILYGSLWASRQDVIAASKQAHAHSFIEQRLDRGYETVIGGQGNRLSGGQRQRIALARAILRDPAIFILDEATSQIDLESEQLIQQTLDVFTRNRTTIIITHRPATLALADRIVVMDAGRIVDVGTHEQLEARCQLYGRLQHFQLRQSA